MSRSAPCMLLALFMSAVLVPVASSAPDRAQPAGLNEMRTFAQGLLASGMYEESIEAYQAVVAATPDNPRSYYELASALGFVRRYAEAIEAIEQAISLNSGEALYYELAAIAHQQMKQYEQAMTATLHGAELGDIKAMYTVAGMFEHGRGTVPSPELALKWLRQAAEAGHMGAMHGMARVYTEGLYGQAPDDREARRWNEKLEHELGR